jgi:hypothetical protein
VAKFKALRKRVAVHVAGWEVPYLIPDGEFEETDEKIIEILKRCPQDVAIVPEKETKKHEKNV